MFRANVLCFPWDVMGEPLDDTLAFIRGELGATGVTLFAACPPTVRVLQCSGDGPRWLRTRGGLFFHPDEGRYAHTRCKPIKSDRLKTRNPVAECVEACHGRGLSLRLAVSTMRMGRVAERYSAAAVKNVLGGPSLQRLCPSNPDAVELMGAVVEDLSTHYEPEAVELRDFDRGYRHEATAGLESAVGPGDVGDALLSLCFCESCCQGARDAGVNVEAAVRSANVTLARVLSGERADSETFADLVGRDEILAGYLRWQSGVLAERLGAIRARCASRLVLHRRGDEVVGTADLRLLSGHVDAVCVRRERSGAPRIRTVIETVVGQCASAGEVAVEFPLGGDRGLSPQALVAEVHEAADAGCNDTTFADLGLLAARDTDVVKQAIRYARRTADG